MSEQSDAFGLAIQVARARLGLTIGDAATQAKVTRKTWARVEHGLPVRMSSYGGVDKVFDLATGTTARCWHDLDAKGWTEAASQAPESGFESSTPNQEHFACRVRALRLDNDWSQMDLQARLAEVGLNLHQTTISKIERGTITITVEHVAAYAEVFHVEVSSLVSAPRQARAMKVIEHASRIAEVVLPGPLGEVIGAVLTDQVALGKADRNLHELARRIVLADASFRAGYLVSRKEMNDLHAGLASQLLATEETESSEQADRWAGMAIRSLFALSPRLLVADDESLGTFNLVGQFVHLSQRVRELSEVGRLKEAENARLRKRAETSESGAA